MSGDSDLFRAFIVSHEAWYHQYQPDGMRDRELLVQLASTGGGVKWEFGIREQPRVNSVRVEMFADAWVAFSDCPDLFSALAEFGEGATLGEVRDLLAAQGFRDITERERVRA